jgi:hypothetical protein
LEILALLLLGLIAMLAIVPPIIRGKLDESPLATTQSFQRSMQEMANSIEGGTGREEAPHRGGGATGHLTPVGGASGDQLRSGQARIASRRRAAIRRNRVLAALAVFATLWGTAALLSGKTWCLVIFAFMCIILAVFWGMTLVIPNLYARPRPRAVRPPEEVSRSPRSQVL